MTQHIEDLVDSFGGYVVKSLEKSGEGSLGEFLSLGGEERADSQTIRVVISTLPAGAKFVLPEWIYRISNEKPVVFDVNYKPYYTDLLQQAERMNCNFVRGSEMLWEQGVGQFELWTERAAPYRVMKEVVLNNCVHGASQD
jgi:shikimate 5-dehydrogenase